MSLAAMSLADNYGRITKGTEGTTDTDKARHTYQGDMAMIDVGNLDRRLDGQQPAAANSVAPHLVI